MSSAGAAIFRLLMAAALIVVFVAAYDPANAQESRIQIQAVSADDWPTIELTLTAFDDRGQPYAGLGPGDISATVGSESAPISQLSTTSDPGFGIAVVLAFDVSGSMAGSPLEQARVAGQALVDQLGPDDQAAVLAFGSEVSVRQPFTADKAALNAAIESLGTAGDTALYGGVQASAQLVSESSLPRRAIVLLSDGFDFGGVSAVDRNTSIESIRQSGAFTFTVGLGADIDQEYLGQVAQAGQGQFLSAPAPADLTSAYLAAGEVLRRQYVLTLDASGIVPTSAETVLGIEVSIGGQTVTATAPLAVPPGALSAGETEAAPTQAPVVEPVPQEEPQAVAQSDEESTSLPWVWIMAVTLAAAFAAVTILRARQRRVGRVAAGAPSDAPELTPDRFDREPQKVVFPEIARAFVPNGTSAWLEGPQTGRIPLAGAPLTLGVTADCDVRLPPVGGAHQARVRIWRRDGNYMIHNLSQPPAGVTIGGRPVSWAILEDGDVITIGAETIAFHLTESP